MTKPLLLLLLLAPPAWRGLAWVRDRNAAVAAGQAAYARGDAGTAATAFARAAAINRASAGAAALLLNLGHAQRRAGQLAAARATYGQLLDASVPAALGSVARQQLAVLAAEAGEVAPALGLLRQALVLDPANAGARYNYEVLSAYLARHRATPQMGPPPRSGGAPPAPKRPVPDGKSPNNQPTPSAGSKAGTDRPGLVRDPAQPASAPNGPSQPRPNATGAPDRGPTPTPGTMAGRRAPAPTGPTGSAPTGTQPGGSQGLNTAATAGPTAPAGRGRAPGTDDARATDARLQTQRERLRAMNLSPAQAQQLLDALKAQEQQYLQQVPRPAGPAVRRGQPTW